MTGRSRLLRSRSLLTGGAVSLAAVLSTCHVADGSSSPKGPDVLKETWNAYAQRFILPDGRVVDPKAANITTSEGQAYAMLRAVWIGDRALFDRCSGWARRNLNQGVRTDRLWAWKWAPSAEGPGRVLDSAFASDADEDAALALLFAWRTWGDTEYLNQARGTLADLWDQGTLVVGGRRYLLGGDTLCQGTTCRLNPSYGSPYAYRTFAKWDSAHDWSRLVDSAYFLLETNSGLTSTGLPSDWILLDTRSGALKLGDDRDSSYSYDAFRVHWRVAADSAVFRDVRAERYLASSLAWLAERYRKDQRLSAIISKDGQAVADYEALEMLAALAPALQGSAPDVAEALSRRVQSTLADGLWGDRDSYYLQNWAWFGTALYQRQLAPFERAK